MENFSLYFQLGVEHILDIYGYDHILFVLALAAVYQLEEWKKVIVLVTAFTIGHSITLLLATLEIVKVKSEWVEFIIPVTILVTAVSNLLIKNQVQPRVSLNYAYALFFGLIHGLGFSNYLRALLGKAQSIASPLFAFNIGLEMGQIIIVVLFLFVSFIVTSWIKVRHRQWQVVISSAIALLSLFLIQDRIFWT